MYSRDWAEEEGVSKQGGTARPVREVTRPEEKQESPQANADHSVAWPWTMGEVN